MTRHLLLIAVITSALALAACGSSRDGKEGGDPDKAYAGALKFAKCMREHGIDMPDPTRNADGGILQRMGGPGDDGPALDQGKMKAADDACAKYREQGGGTPPSPAEQAKAQDAFLAYARCMRAKGIDMPDPKFEGGRISMMLKGGPGASTSPDSPVFKAADKACHPRLAVIDRKVGGGGPGSSGGSLQGPKP